MPPRGVSVKLNCMLNVRITVFDATNTWPPASAGVEKRFMLNAALWKT